MPNINFSDVPDAEDYPLLPDGTYPFRVNNVEVINGGTSQERWTLKLIITEGDAKGALLRDSLFWSQKALPRIKLFCSRVGISTEGAVNLHPKDLLDREGYVIVTTEVWDEKEVNRVPFAGYLARELWLDVDKQRNLGQPKSMPTVKQTQPAFGDAQPNAGADDVPF